MKGIIAFGDSILKGTYVDEGKYRINPQRFTAILEEQLCIPVENRGQMGSTIIRLEKSMSRATGLLESSDYDTIFLSYGGNDADYDWQKISDDPSAEHICNVPIDQFMQLYLDGISELKKTGKEIYLLSLPPIDANKYYNWVSKDRNADAILQWLNGDVNHMTRWHEMFNLAVFKIGAIANIPVIDISSCFLTKRKFSELICEDGIHPTTAGQKLIAEAIISQL